MKHLIILIFILLSAAVYAQDSCNITYGLRVDPYKPYEWIDDNGVPHGMNVDLLKQMAKKAGCTYTITPGERDELLYKLKNNEITMMSISPIPEADQFAAYIEQSVVIYRYAVNRIDDPPIESMEDWRGKTVLFMKGSYTDSYLQKHKDEYNLNLISYQNHIDMVEDYLAGRGDFFVASLPSILNLPKHYEIKICGFPIIPTIYGFAMNKTNSALYARLNDAMEELKASGDYFEIMKKWSRSKDTPLWHKYMIHIVLTVVLTILLMLLWNKSLHMRVHQKTASLNTLTGLLQMLLDVLPEQIYLINSNGMPVWSNAASSNANFKIELISNEIEQAIVTNKSFETKLFLDNTETWEVSGIILEKGSEPLLIVASNITEKVRQRDELLVLDRMTALGNMAANIAHEINNPAGLIMHNIDFLQKLSNDIHKNLETPDPSRRFAGLSWIDARQEEISAHTIITENILRIINTVNDLKTFSKKRDDAYALVDLKLILNDSVRFVGYFVKSFTRNFTCRIDEPVAPVRGHAQHIEQIIINLIQNACYALTDSEQAITCSLSESEDGKYVVFSIEDEGCGMSPEVKQKAFESFYTTRKNGTGLGLSIVASIVKEHWGHYILDSEEGEGTRVRIFFPKETL
ncbi:integral membrane sensor signal transduction histidine kinase [Denitrovibrio acetiphilus DSM 12809]|uniref:histidine kinase n=1 Tax=Denitrovibrio acetiphilus (strain DSM 12809 / NBRC 114555 / N2460) TaxID=522772 RepID=D4H2I1_DENA2|nr:transporter substrate-binding domain-containing protein [Denitrovibrio acetiphilus]ADD67042.1 integral membrane sensor signal transduction histidine kinase [Denitrovibrio acetiphilus DSM 12809]